MKRDFELVRQIVKEMEEAAPMENYNRFTFEGYDSRTVHEHLEIMIEAGLLDGRVHRDHGDEGMPLISRLTWAGHDFAAATRDEGVWRKAKALLFKQMGGVTLEVLTLWLKHEMKTQLGLPGE